MGSSPILTETPPLSSSSGRVLRHKAHLVKVKVNFIFHLDAHSNYLVNAWSARGHRFESYSSRHNGKIAQLVEHVHNENASSFI